MTTEKSVIRAFTEEQAASLTGLTVHRLKHWDRIKFFVPSFAAENRRSPYSRVYSFKDLLSLQILKALRLDLGCSLQHLREVKSKLGHLGDRGWSTTTLYVLNRKVVFHDTDKDELRDVVSGQIVLQIPLKVVRAKMQDAVAGLSKRTSADIGQIEKKRNVNHNAAVIGGTRIPVSAVKRLYDDGFDVARILAEYPSLTEADVKKALHYSNNKHAA